MTYDTAAERVAYAAGAAEAVEAVFLEMSATGYRELEQWLLELRAWSEGEPPPAPHHWTSDEDTLPD
ncbi:hypothetical protein ACWPM1_04220 [Tsuneonella sp. HG249]